ncbi:MAG: hypothetical protein R3E94_18270 [Burkholderiaceae bacterium]
MSKSDKKMEDSEKPNMQQGWRKYIYTEEGFGLIFISFVAALSWCQELWGNGASYDGFFHRKIRFLEPIFGEHYMPIFLTIMAIAIALEVWRKGRR